MNRPDELINLTGFAQDEHLIVYRDGRLKFFLPASCPGDIVLHVVEDLLDELSSEVTKLSENPR